MMEIEGRSNQQAGRDINFANRDIHAKRIEFVPYYTDDAACKNIMRLQALQISLLLCIFILCAIHFTNENMMRRDIDSLLHTANRTQLIIENKRW